MAYKSGTCSGDSGGPLTLFNTLKIISAVKEYLNEFHKNNMLIHLLNCTLHIFIVHK